MLKLLTALFAAGKLGKVLTTGSTMLLSIGAYALIWGWAYAVGVVVLIFIHEMGHYIAARRRGLNVGAPTFIPFVGAWVELKDMPHDAETEAYVGMAGPLVGTLGALACYYLARNYDSDFLLAISYTGFFLNLFNLIPLLPFDGGRITQVISPRLWMIGVPVLGLLFFYRPSPMLILMALFAAPHVWHAIKTRGAPPQDESYYAVKAEDRWMYGTLYLGLAAYLAIMCYDVHEMLAHVKP